MANIELDGVNKKIKVDSGDLTLDVPGDIVLDADGGDVVVADGGTNILKVTNSSSDVVLQPQVDAKDIIFKQYDGTTVATVEDNGTFNVPASKLAIGGTAVTSTAAELNILDGVTSTAAELNIVDGGTSATSTTIADADRVVLNDNGTMVQAAVTDLKTYIGGFDVTSITGATALGAEPATTDEFVLSDAGTLKRVDYSHIRSGMSFLAKVEYGSATGSDTIDIQNFVTSSFKKYRIYMNFSDTSDNIDAHFRFLDSSNNTISSGYYVYAFGHKNNGSGGSDEGWLDSNTTNPRLFDNIDAGDKMVATGEYTFFPKGQGNGHQNVLMGTYGFVQQADYLVQGSIYARCTNTTDATGIRFYLSSGVWNKVDIEVYGLRI